MNKSISAALLVIGIVLTIWGISASDSVGSGISRIFTGAPTDKTVWLLVGGVLAGVVGLFGVLRAARQG
ncbi:MAG: hypothetical protein RIS76_1096 [Verrucomicrobiota bacterium]|jgi:Protein of unknown function (DUF3185)